ncbi:hypothetical protein ACOMHN_066416 [Nucella lapillus]
MAISLRNLNNCVQWNIVQSLNAFLMEDCVITAVDVGGVYDCNPPWRNGDTVKITFRIDRSQYPLKCAQGTTSGKPVFQTSPYENVAYSANCTVTTDIRASCTLIPGTIGCGCTNSNDNGFYVVEYNFIFGPDYHRYWEAEVACLDSATFSPALNFTNTDSNCKPVSVLCGLALFLFISARHVSYSRVLIVFCL